MSKKAVEKREGLQGKRREEEINSGLISPLVSQQEKNVEDCGCGEGNNYLLYRK